MPNKFDKLLEDLAGSKFAASLSETLEDDEKRAKLTRNINVVVMAVVGRRALRKGLSSAGLSDEQAKLIARAVPYAAYLIGSGIASGQLYAEDAYDDLYGLDEDSD